MSETATWQPSASIPNLLKRAAVMAEIRRFSGSESVSDDQPGIPHEAAAGRRVWAGISAVPKLP